MSKSLGRKFLREEGVARCWSVEVSLLHSDAAEDAPLAEGPHRDAVVAVDHGSTLLPEDVGVACRCPGHPEEAPEEVLPPLPMTPLTSLSDANSASMVVLLRMQLFRLPCAFPASSREP